MKLTRQQKKLMEASILVARDEPTSQDKAFLARQLVQGYPARLPDPAVARHGGKGCGIACGIVPYLVYGVPRDKYHIAGIYG